MTTNRIEADIPAATTRPRSQAIRGSTAASPRDAPRNAPTAELSIDIYAVPTDPGAAIVSLAAAVQPGISLNERRRIKRGFRECRLREVTEFLQAERKPADRRFSIAACPACAGWAPAEPAQARMGGELSDLAARRDRVDGLDHAA